MSPPDRSGSSPRARHGHLAAALLAATLACAPVLPEAPVERALVRDLARVVDVKGRTGWLIDEVEMEAMLPNALKAACQVEAPERGRALAWVDGRIGLLGGDVAEAWRARGRDLDQVSDLLFWTRVRMILARSDEWIRAGRCPFWLEGTPRFKGVHTQGGRFIASIEGGGRFTMERALGNLRFGGGGSGRLLAGYGLSDTWAILGGLEAGGDARFTNLSLGKVSEVPELAAIAAAPVVVRWNFGLSTHAEAEAGPLLFVDRATADQNAGTIDASAVPGVRFGLGVGGSYLRIQQGVIPRFTFSFTLDFIPAADGRPTLLQLGFGARTGLDFSFWKGF